MFGDISMAIAREKEIKGWRREKKVWLIERDNRTWEDMAETLWPEYGKPKTVKKKQVPHRHSQKTRLGSG
jgi:putative endonuclease